MTIRVKLLTGTIGIASLKLIFIVILLYSVSVVHRTAERQKIAEEIGMQSFQLSLLRGEYQQYPGTRAKEQWVNQLESLMRSFQEHTTTFSHVPEKEIIDKLRTSIERSRVLFGELVRNVERGGNDTIIQELANQLALQAQNRSELVTRLSEIGRHSVAQITETLIYAVLLIGLIMFAIAVGIYFMNKKIVASIVVLGEGTKKITKGDLNYQLPILGDDEIGEVSHLFNVMATKLRESYGSLEKKVKEKTAQLREEMEKVRKFQQALAASSEAIIILSHPELTVTYVNPSWSRLTGYSSSEVLGKRMEYSRATKTDQKIIDGLRNAMHAGQMFHSEEFVLQKKDGTEYAAELTMYPVYKEEELDANRVLFFVCIHRDITRKKRSEEAKNEFVSLASHQLRTPLTEIRWALSSMEREQLTDEQKEMVETAHEASSHMAETIKAMLTISHIETGEMNLDLTDMNLCSAIDDIVRLYDGEKHKKKIKLTVECANNIHMRTDEQLFKEVVGNLLINAYKYTLSGGKVSIIAKEEKDHIHLDVTDTGCGIPLQDQEHIAQKFFRASNIVDQEGSGLGLHMSYSLMRLLGGTIAFTTQENTGTTFSLTFPRSL